MRVGLFTESYDPVINGVSASVKTFGLELRQIGHQPVVVAPRFSGYKDLNGSGTLPVLRLPSWRTPFNPQNPFAFPPFGPLPTALRSARFDVVHTQQPFGMGMHGRRMARLLGVPLVSTFHTLYTEYVHYFPCVPRPLAIWWVAREMRRYYATCDAVIVPSREAGRRLTLAGVSVRQQIVVPTGIASAAPISPEQREEARCRYGLPAQAPVILFVGRVAREKNLDLLLDAFAVICADTGERTNAPHLLIVGSGPYRTGCEIRARQLGLLGRVRFAGFVPREDLGPLYALADVFAFPSATETQGMVVAEAQSHGLPCVVVDQGGAAELVRDGIDAQVTPVNKAAFTIALRRFLDDAALRARFGEEARRNPLRPTPEQMARQIVNVYDAVRASHHSIDFREAG